MVAILDPEALSAVRMTVDEYLQADLPEGFHYELVDGVVVMSPTPGGEHDAVLDRLNLLLVDYRRSHPNKVGHVSFNSTVPIPGKQSAREPDIAVYSEWEAMGRGTAVWKKFIPALAIEIVSPDQEDRDYDEKPDDYWLAGVTEYWIVDSGVGEFTVLRRGKEVWQKESFRVGDRFSSSSFEGLEVAVAHVLHGL